MKFLDPESLDPTGTSLEIGSVYAPEVVALNLEQGRAVVTYHQPGIEDGEEVEMLQIWDTNTGQKIGALFEGDPFLGEIVPSPGGTWVAIIGIGGNTRLIEMKTGQLVDEIKETEAIRSVKFGLDDSSIAVSNFPSRIRFWNPEEKSLSEPILPEIGNHRSPAFIPDSSLLITIGKLMQLWDPQTGEMVRSFESSPAGFVEAAVFSPDGSQVAGLTQTGDDSGVVYLWDYETGVLIGGPLKYSGQPVTAMRFSPDGQKILVHNDSSFTVWDRPWDPAVACEILEPHRPYLRLEPFIPEGRQLEGCHQP